MEITLPLFIREVRELKKCSDNLMTLSMAKVLTIYLFNIKEFLKADSMLTVETITEKLVNFINKNYEKVLEEFQDESKYYIRRTVPPKHQSEYCCYEKCDYLPVFIHAFLKRLDEETDEMEITYLNDLCQWALTKGLTYIKLMKPEVYEVG